MWGRDYRKLKSQMWAGIALRWVAVWIAIAGCSSYGDAGKSAALVIIAADVLASAMTRVVLFSLLENQRKDWLDRLTNRCFYRLFFDGVRDGGAGLIDVDEMFKMASKAAIEDIEMASEKDLYMDGPLWHVWGGILHFAWHSVSLIAYYSSDVYLGSSAA